MALTRQPLGGLEGERMFGFRKRKERDDLVGRFHEAVATASRATHLYGQDGFPDTVAGRFESLTLHMLFVLRRLRQLPPPAAEVAQELVDAVFSRLEIALRESGIGDMGVPKRMKVLARDFYDRSARYEAALSDRSEAGLAAELARRLGGEPDRLRALTRHLLEVDQALAGCDLGELLAGQRFAAISIPQPRGTTA